MSLHYDGIVSFQIQYNVEMTRLYISDLKLRHLKLLCLLLQTNSLSDCLDLFMFGGTFLDLGSCVVMC